MKKNILIVWIMCSAFLASAQTFTVTPTVFSETDEITITISDFDPSTAWGVPDIYLWAWYFDLNDVFVGDSPTNGQWTNSDESQKFTNNGDGSYSFTLTPNSFYEATGIGSIGFLAKADNGNDGQTIDNLSEVGLFQVSLISPVNESTVVDSGTDVVISASSTIHADFQLFVNGSTTPIDTQNGSTTYNYN